MPPELLALLMQAAEDPSPLGQWRRAVAGNVPMATEQEFKLALITFIIALDHVPFILTKEEYLEPTDAESIQKMADVPHRLNPRAWGVKPIEHSQMLEILLAKN